MTLCREAFTKYSLVEPTSSLCTAEGKREAMWHHLTGQGKGSEVSRVNDDAFCTHKSMYVSLRYSAAIDLISLTLMDKRGGNVLQMCDTIIIINVCQTSSCKHQSCDAESQGFGLKPVTVLVDPPAGEEPPTSVQ